MRLARNRLQRNKGNLLYTNTRLMTTMNSRSMRRSSRRVASSSGSLFTRQDLARSKVRRLRTRINTRNISTGTNGRRKPSIRVLTTLRMPLRTTSTKSRTRRGIYRRGCRRDHTRGNKGRNNSLIRDNLRFFRDAGSFPDTVRVGYGKAGNAPLIPLLQFCFGIF